ncbi:hypothetical protein FACS1894137_11460 [Spirochaetia bacterium]|nr:hypothetical protein FACS1894137_11460 [Spirochaetia bacterium]
MGCDRKNMADIVLNAGYNISVESKKLEQKYLDLVSLSGFII